MHGIAEAAQAIDVAPQGSTGDVQSAGEFCSRPTALCLEERQQAKQPGRRLQHKNDCATNRGPNLSSISDSVSGIDSANPNKADRLENGDDHEAHRFLSCRTGSGSGQQPAGAATRTGRSQRLETASEVDASRLSGVPGGDHAVVDCQHGEAGRAGSEIASRCKVQASGVAQARRTDCGARCRGGRGARSSAEYYGRSSAKVLE